MAYFRPQGIHIHLSSLYSEQNFLKIFIALMQYSQHPNNIIGIMLEPQPIPQGSGTGHPPPNMVPPVPFDGTCIASLREGESCQSKERKIIVMEMHERLTNTHVRYKIYQERDKESRFKRCMK